MSVLVDANTVKGQCVMESRHYDLEHWLSIPRDLEINCRMKVLKFMFASTRWSKVCLELESLHVDIATI